MLSDENAPRGVYFQRAPSARNRLELIQLPDPEVPCEAILYKCNGDKESFVTSREAHIVCKLITDVCETSSFVLFIWTFNRNRALEIAHWIIDAQTSNHNYENYK